MAIGRRQAQKVTYCRIIYLKIGRIDKSIDRTQTEGCQGVVVGRGVRSDYLMGTGCLLGVMKMFWNFIEVL